MQQFLLANQWIGDLSWLNDVYDVLPGILYAILAAVGGAGSVYSIILGVNLAKSENDEKRRYAAYRLRNTLIGIAVLIALVMFINLALPAILKAAFPDNWGSIDGSKPGDSGTTDNPTVTAPGTDVMIKTFFMLMR